jgi:protein required for attachment to host cells
MQIPNGAVIAVVDGRRFNLFRNSGNEAEPVLSALPSPRLDEHNKSDGGRRDSSSQNPTGHQIEEDAHAAAAVDWLSREVLEHRIDKLIVIAAPRTLGTMRGHYRKPLEGAIIGELSKDLGGRSGPEIAAAIAGH